MDTTRRYPRTMREAFPGPGSANYACAIERPPARMRGWHMAALIGIVLLAVAALISIVLLAGAALW